MSEHSKTFENMSGAIIYIKSYGYDFKKATPVSMGEGYEHIWVWECLNGTDRVCRIADLTNAQRKIQPEDRIPNMIGFVQISIKQVV